MKNLYNHTFWTHNYVNTCMCEMFRHTFWFSVREFTLPRAWVVCYVCVQNCKCSIIAWDHIVASKCFLQVLQKGVDRHLSSHCASKCFLQVLPKGVWHLRIWGRHQEGYASILPFYEWNGARKDGLTSHLSSNGRTRSSKLLHLFVHLLLLFCLYLFLTLSRKPCLLSRKPCLYLSGRQRWRMKCQSFIIMALGSWYLFRRERPLLVVVGFTVKYHHNGSIERYKKAHVVAKG